MAGRPATRAAKAKGEELPKTNIKITNMYLKNEYGLTYEEYVAPIWDKSSRVWTMALEDEIFTRVANGEPIKTICKDEHMPSYGAWQRWFHGNVKFIPLADAERLRVRYAQAMRDYGGVLGAKIIAISYDDEHDTMTIKKGDHEKEVMNKEWVMRSKLKIEALQWIASKLLPHMYGDKVTVEHTGKIQHEQTPSIEMDQLTPVARDKLVTFLKQVEADKAAGLMQIDHDDDVIDAEYKEV